METVISGNDFRLSNTCIDRFRYMRIYHSGSRLLDGMSDNGFRLFRSLLLFSDVDDGCTHLYIKLLKLKMVQYAYQGVNDTDYNYRRRYHRGITEMEARGLVKRFRTGNGRCAMVNPMVAYMADYRGRKMAIKKWKEINN